ncbi:transposase [Purpureocillium lavendulum]|uniref:Transposase n=1 Tax=Purpureocillium lavendulum TaxID=1247861 RepID=A0AB34FCP4_9HYPO|nr:transposase [Purpureocillium lavendulum]
MVASGGSVKKASRDWGVPRATLYNRMNGHECRKDAFSSLQRLSQTQEKQLTEWILIQDALRLPPTHSQIRQFAQRMLAVKGDHVPLGKHWVQAFLRRSPAVRTQKCHHRDSARVNGASTEVIRPWFNNSFLPEIQAIKPEHRYNMDEAGIMEGLGENGLVHRLPAQLKQLQRADKVGALVLAHEVGAFARGSTTTSCDCPPGYRLALDVLHGRFQSSLSSSRDGRLISASHHRNCSLAMRTSSSGEDASNSASSSCSSALGLGSDSQTPSMRHSQTVEADEVKVK